MESREIHDMYDVYMYAAGLESKSQHLHYENAAKLFISYQIAAVELCQLDNTLGAILTAA